MKTYIMATLLVMAATPVLADQMLFFGDEAFIRTDHGGMVVCELLGVSSRTIMFDTPLWQKLKVEQANHKLTTKPLPGYCMNAYDMKQRVPIGPGWPFNLGQWGGIIGIECATAEDAMSFSCSW